MKKLVILTGAGVSAESGLGTYRDNGGLWDNYDPMEVASIEGWYRNKELVLNFYNMQREHLAQVQPNSAHMDMVALARQYEVTVITQNVDNLHERAGSTDVIHLHGELTKVRPENTFNEADNFSESMVRDIGYGKVCLGDKGVNGVQLRPHIVFFGEAVPRLSDAARAVMAADIVLIVGTSLQVYPAASLYTYARPGIPVYIIDPADLRVSDPRLIHIRETATEGMKRFCAECVSL